MTRSGIWVRRTESVCIIGAGAAGITAASALRRRGFERVVLLERAFDHAGGKCRSITRDGLAIDVGAVYVLPNYPLIARLAREVGLDLREAARFVHHADGQEHRPFGTPTPPLPQRTAEFLRLGLELARHNVVLRRPLGLVDPAHIRGLSMPFAEWMSAHRLEYFHRCAYPLLRSFGFGFEEQRIPAAYIVNAFLRLARSGNPLSLWDLRSLRLFHIDGGYGELLRRLAQPLDLRLGARIDRVERTAGRVFVDVDGETLEFDKLIVACPLPRALQFLDVTETERELFDKIRSFDVWQVSARVHGLDDAILIDVNQTTANFGKPMIAFRYRADSDWYYFFGYGRDGQGEDEIATDVKRTISTLGGSLVGEPSVHRWSGYFPHYDSQELAAGYHAELEQLQGQRSTYYAGEIMSNIGVEAVARYSEDLVARLVSGVSRTTLRAGRSTAYPRSATA